LHKTDQDVHDEKSSKKCCGKNEDWRGQTHRGTKVFGRRLSRHGSRDGRVGSHLRAPAIRREKAVRRRRIVLVIIILKDGFPEAGFVWDACCLTLDEPLEEGGSDAIGHDVRWPSDVADLHCK
jgi:hypothetical protein